MALVDTTISWLMTNWWAAIGLLAVGLLAYWVVDERENEGSTIEGVGERADSFFDVGLGAFGSLVVVVFSIVITIGDRLSMLTADLIGIFADGPPLLLTNIAGALIGYAGLAGYVPVDAGAYAIVVIALIILGYSWRRRAAA